VPRRAAPPGTSTRHPAASALAPPDGSSDSVAFAGISLTRTVPSSSPRPAPVTGGGCPQYPALRRRTTRCSRSQDNPDAFRTGPRQHSQSSNQRTRSRTTDALGSTTVTGLNQSMDTIVRFVQPAEASLHRSGSASSNHTVLPVPPGRVPQRREEPATSWRPRPLSSSGGRRARGAGRAAGRRPRRAGRPSVPRGGPAGRRWARGVPQRVGHQLADQQRRDVGEGVEVPVPQLAADGGACGADGAWIRGKGPLGAVAFGVDHADHIPGQKLTHVRFHGVNGHIPDIPGRSTVREGALWHERRTRRSSQPPHAPTRARASHVRCASRSPAGPSARSCDGHTFSSPPPPLPVPSRSWGLRPQTPASR
jgi:hypothetical protein